MRVELVCANCGHIIQSEEVKVTHSQEVGDMPVRIKVPVCNLCSEVKKEWKKR